MENTAKERENNRSQIPVHPILTKAILLMEKITKAITFIGMAGLIFMTIITVVDVVGRYFFNKPLIYSIEFTEIWMVLTVFSAIAYTALLKQHIKVDIITSHLSPKTQAVTESIALTASLIFVSLISWRSIVRGLLLQPSTAATPFLHVPIYLLHYFIAFGTALLALVLLLELCFSILRGIMKLES